MTKRNPFITSHEKTQTNQFKETRKPIVLKTEKTFF